MHNPYDNEERRRRREQHQAEKDFWREWRDEIHQMKHEFSGWRHEDMNTPSSEEVQAWREYFHHSMGDWPDTHWMFGGRRFSPWRQGMDSFNPFLATLLSKGGGLLPLYVLHLIAQKPRYGNEVMELLSQRTGGQWISNPGAIYPLLSLLERLGFIQGRWEDPEKRTIRIYTITQTGLTELARIKSVVTPKIEETLSVLKQLLDEMETDPEPDGSSNNPTNKA